MNRVKVDQTGFGSIRFMEAEPKMKYEDGKLTDQQDTDENGVPLFSITCAIKPTGGRGEVITVKVPSAQPPAFEEFSKIAFANLTAYAYVAGNRSQFSFSADKVGKARE